ncbi:MAG: PDZ domain-containing protein [Chloroflexi bacterium]|nr:PDZ domain-containing protein [Chloroflexota bacterium]
MRGRAALTGLLLVGLLISSAFAPASMFAPLRVGAEPGTSSVDAPDVDRSAQPMMSPDVDAPRAVVNQGDAEPGITLITAVYNSIQDRFFKPLDSRDLLDAAWEGARRALAEQRKLPSGVADPQFTGDRNGDLQAFVAQYRALLSAAGSGVDANRVAMATSDLMTQSVGEQHTVFLPPEAFARFRQSLTSDSGRVGLGILIQGQSAPFRIGSVVPGAPAEKAGVMDNDIILAVDGRSTSRMELRDVSDALRGEEGQSVTLTLQRGDGGQTMDIVVTRARFSEPPLTMKVLPEGVCHFRLSTFPVAFIVGPTGRTIGEDLDYYLEQCEQAGGKGWIMDLRGNGGGASLVQVLGRFIDAGPILVERDKIGGRYEQATDGHLFRVQRPLVVLIDGNSASASEGFASAVQEYKRGVVMGRQSAGALNTGNIVPLPLGAGMMVAIRQVFTGKQEIAVDEVGVTPDVSLNMGRDPSVAPPEAIQAALSPPADVGPLPAGPSTTDGLLTAEQMKQRAAPVLLQAGDASRPEDQQVRGEMAFDTLHYYASDYPSIAAARARAIRLGWQGVYARWIGAGFPPPYAITVSFYRDGDGAHKDMREIYEADEPRNPPQYKDVDSPVTLGDETLAQVGTGQNEGRIWISWRRGGTVYTVSQNVPPGDTASFDELARLAQIVDSRAAANP